MTELLRPTSERSRTQSTPEDVGILGTTTRRESVLAVSENLQTDCSKAPDAVAPNFRPGLPIRVREFVSKKLARTETLYQTLNTGTFGANRRMHSLHTTTSLIPGNHSAAQPSDHQGSITTQRAEKMALLAILIRAVSDMIHSGVNRSFPLL